MISTCEYLEICKTIYTELLSTYCTVHNNSIKTCRLIKDIQEEKISPFVMDLIGKYSNKSVNKQTLEVECPRSTISNISINKSCSLHSCPYYAIKMSYNCMLIHKDIFFFNNSEIPNKLMEIITELDTSKFARIIELGVYQSRIIIILLTYFKNMEMDNICSLCSFVIPGTSECMCLSDKDLRRKRINFSRHWKECLQGNETIVKEELENFEAKHIASQYDIFSLDFIRAWINYPTINKKNISDLPFGYVLCSYFRLFNNSLDTSMENLGLTSKLFKRAMELFPVGGNL